MKKRMIIIDTHSLLYRAFYALPQLTDQRGRLTNAAYGFLLTLFKAIKDVKATCVVACFDTPKPTFRHEAFKEYKAHRPEMPEGIVSQIAIVKEILKTMDVPIFEKDGYEADDLIATIAEKEKKESDVYIVSGDLDNLQLIDENVKVYTLGKGIRESVIYNREKVVERFGVEPSQMNDFKALVGDVSDNIPGVPGIGKGAAADLMRRFGNIENLYSEMSTNTALLKPKIKEALTEHKEKAFLSLQLVKTDKNVPLDFHQKDCHFGRFDAEKVKNLFKEFGFHSLVERLGTIVV